MAAEKDDFFDDDEAPEPRIIVQKKLPPQTETMDLPEKEPKQKMPKQKKESRPETAPAVAESAAKPAEKAAARPKPAASHTARKMRAVNIPEDTYWAIRKKLVDLRKDTPVDEVLEEAVRLWIRHKSG